MLEVVVSGLGVWSPQFANCQGLLAKLQAADGTSLPASSQRALNPAMLPPRERRRAPQTVKMALEVMSQAMEFTGANGADLVVVTASSMGDMEITDYLCATVSTNPLMISPTSFHNSVHNSAAGHWSISQASHQATSAIAAGEYTGSMGLLEAVTQCVDTQIPVLLVVQEGVAPVSMMAICDSPQPLSLAVLLEPAIASSRGTPFGKLNILVKEHATSWPPLPAELQNDFANNPAGKFLPLFLELAKLAQPISGDISVNHEIPSLAHQTEIELPLATQAALLVSLHSVRGVASGGT